MPPIYDDYIVESGSGEVMTLFCDESTIPVEVPIDYENKVAIYDDYCDDLYAINNNDTHETCHHDFSFQFDYASHGNYVVEFAPTIIHQKKFAYEEDNKFSMLVYHEKNALCDGDVVEFIHDATENYYEGVYMLVGIAIISSFLSMCSKS